MPIRIKTRQGYETWLKNYIVPKWGTCELSELQARPVELWLSSLNLAPKSKVHIRGLLSSLWNLAMWSDAVPVQRNPMELVTIKSASKRLHKPRSLTVAEFQKFIAHLAELFRTMALLSVCFGLRISECLALRWSDVDWLSQTLSIERRIIAQIVDNTKTPESQQDGR
jgi:integrase